jgi:hypothetical protein
MSGAQTSRVHEGLMRDMNAPAPYHFNPLPPRSHRTLMDIDQPLHIRYYGWVLWRTIDRDRRGNHGPKKWHRSAHAQDERGDLGEPHAAKDLGVTEPDARKARLQCQASGWLRVDEDGRIFLAGDAPEPRRNKSEDEKKEIMYKTLPEHLRLYFQQLDISERNRRTAEYWKVQETRKKFEADAIAQARDAADELERRWESSIGYQRPDPPPSGRKKKDRAAALVKLTLVHDGNDFVQNLFEDLYEMPEGSVQTDSSLLIPEQLERVSKSLENPVISSTAEEKPETHLPAPEAQSQNLPDKREEGALLTERVEASFGRFAPGDPVKAAFVQLPAQFEIPETSVLRAVTNKLKQKQRKGYEIESATALLDFVREMLPGWILRHGDDIQADRESGEGIPGASRRGPAPPPLHPEEELRIAEEFVETCPNHPSVGSFRQRIEELRTQLKGHTKGAGA